MGFAVVQGHGDVDHREAEQGALGHLRLDALVHRPDELPGNSAADHLVDELVSCAAFQGSDLDVADRVLSVAARLLHVTPLSLGRCDEGLPQRHLDRDLVDAQPIALPETCQQQFLVGLPHRPEQLLVRLGVTFQPDGDIFHGQPLQCAAELVLVPPGVGLNRDRQQRLRDAPGPDRTRAIRAGQGIPGLGFGQAGHVDDLTRDGLVFAHQLQADGGGELARLVAFVVVGVRRILGFAEQLAPARDVDGVVGAQRAREDPYQR